MIDLFAPPNIWEVLRRRKVRFVTWLGELKEEHRSLLFVMFFFLFLAFFAFTLCIIQVILIFIPHHG